MKRDNSFDFIRTLCAIGIIWYHFSVGLSKPSFRPFSVLANGITWGSVMVAIFFMLSGALLYLHHHVDFSLKEFYWKRFKSIYPMFWLIYLFYFSRMMIGTGGKWFLSAQQKWKTILSFLGVDGYLYEFTSDFYIVGEWFLGMIIFLYLIYPLLVKAVDKKPALTLIVLVVIFAVFRNKPVLTQNSNKSLISSVMSFAAGIYIMKYHLFDKKFLCWICLAASIIVIFVNLPGVNGGIVSGHVLSFLLFLGLHPVGELCTRGRVSAGIWKWLSALTYPVFLIQHQVIVEAIAGDTAVSALHIMVQGCSITLLIFIYAWMLNAVNKEILHSRMFKKLENYVLKEV